MEQNEDRITPFINGAGNGFLVGHGLAVIGCAFHSLNDAPHGQKLQDFITRLPYTAFDSSVQMATWSIVSCAVEPFISPRFQRPWVQNLMTGAATGAILQCRCGISGMLSGAYSGAMQSLTMSLFNHSVGYTIKPIQTYRINKKKKEFYKKRSDDVFLDPVQTLTQAFLK